MSREHADTRGSVAGVHHRDWTESATCGWGRRGGGDDRNFSNLETLDTESEVS